MLVKLVLVNVVTVVVVVLDAVLVVEVSVVVTGCLYGDGVMQQEGKEKVQTVRAWTFESRGIRTIVCLRPVLWLRLQNWQMTTGREWMRPRGMLAGSRACTSAASTRKHVSQHHPHEITSLN